MAVEKEGSVSESNTQENPRHWTLLCGSLAGRHNGYSVYPNSCSEILTSPFDGLFCLGCVYQAYPGRCI